MNSPSDPDPALRAHHHEGTWCEPCLERGIEVARAALAAAEAAPLDVERLARAWDACGYSPEIYPVEWEAVAREYAALAATSREGEGG